LLLYGNKIQNLIVSGRQWFSGKSKERFHWGKVKLIVSQFVVAINMNSTSRGFDSLLTQIFFFRSIEWVIRVLWEIVLQVLYHPYRRVYGVSRHRPTSSPAPRRRSPLPSLSLPNAQPPPPFCNFTKKMILYTSDLTFVKNLLGKNHQAFQIFEDGMICYFF